MVVFVVSLRSLLTLRRAGRVLGVAVVRCRVLNVEKSSLLLATSIVVVVFGSGEFVFVFIDVAAVFV